MVTAFTPSEAKASQTEFKVNNIPDFVIKAVNNLITNNYSKHGFKLYQDDIIDEIQKTYDGDKPFNREMIFHNNWLDFEPVFRQSGWSVNYDKPAYYESYRAHFNFKENK